MKVGELRGKLNKLKKEEIIKLAVEFYKLVPKAKKEDYDIDSLVNNPSVKGKKRPQNKISLLDIEFDIDNFITNAKAQNYTSPNREVSKKDRPKWRFLVKRWYKELTILNRSDKDLRIQAEYLTKLYGLICESCEYRYFSSDDPFQSIGISRMDFYQSVLTLWQEYKGKGILVEKGLTPWPDNKLVYHKLYPGIVDILIDMLNIPDLKYKAIKQAENLIEENNFKPKAPQKKNISTFTSWDFRRKSYRKEEKHNYLTEFVFSVYISLFEYDNGIDFFKKHYHNSDEEIKLYVLIRILFHRQLKEQVLQEIESAIKEGIKPRESLLKIVEHIKESNELPAYM